MQLPQHWLEIVPTLSWWQGSPGWEPTPWAASLGFMPFLWLPRLPKAHNPSPTEWRVLRSLAKERIRLFSLPKQLTL